MGRLRGARPQRASDALDGAGEDRMPCRVGYALALVCGGYVVNAPIGVAQKQEFREGAPPDSSVRGGGWFAVGLAAGHVRAGLAGSAADPGGCLDLAAGGTAADAVRLGGAVHACGSLNDLPQIYVAFVVDVAPRSSGFVFGGGVGIAHYAIIDPFGQTVRPENNATDLEFEAAIAYAIPVGQTLSLELYSRAAVGIAKLGDSYTSGEGRDPGRHVVVGVRAVWW